MSARGRGALLAGLAAAVLLGGAYVATQTGLISSGSLDGREVGHDVGARLSETTGVPIVVFCPASIPRQKSHTADCTAVGPSGARSRVFVTQNDLRGHYQYQVEQPTVLLR